MNVTTRLSEYLKSKNILQKDISTLLGVTPQSVSGIMKGKSEITTSQLVIIANAYKELNLRWLLTGEGEMIKKNGIIEKSNDSISVISLEKDKRIQELENHIETLKNYVSFLEFSLGKNQKNGSK